MLGLRLTRQTHLTTLIGIKYMFSSISVLCLFTIELLPLCLSLGWGNTGSVGDGLF